ncbi:hypothetical protein CYMTET_47385 [Cymbomonas tetramitiformis]|uniref:Uncharacterized protein n=1 Tax=Cymbomonas tetramitiformis TaxID=36881 RepID=A0AAE0BUE0_9CHLO|nr:hypothetical protein CYMTET_47385 [Cymbomonas tetramitiformis]
MGANRGKQAVVKAIAKKKEENVVKCVVRDCAVPRTIVPKIQCKTCQGYFHFACSSNEEVGVICKQCGPRPGKCVYCKKSASIMTCGVCGGGFHPSCQRKFGTGDCGLLTNQKNCGRKECEQRSECTASEVAEDATEATVKTLASIDAPRALAGLAKEAQSSRRKSLDWPTSALKTGDAGGLATAPPSPPPPAPDESCFICEKDDARGVHRCSHCKASYHNVCMVAKGIEEVNNCGRPECMAKRTVYPTSQAERDAVNLAKHGAMLLEGALENSLPLLAVPSARPPPLVQAATPEGVRVGVEGPSGGAEQPAHAPAPTSTEVPAPDTAGLVVNAPSGGTAQPADAPAPTSTEVPAPKTAGVVPDAPSGSAEQPADTPAPALSMLSEFSASAPPPLEAATPEGVRGGGEEPSGGTEQPAHAPAPTSTEVPAPDTAGLVVNAPSGGTAQPADAPAPTSTEVPAPKTAGVVPDAPSGSAEQAAGGVEEPSGAAAQPADAPAPTSTEVPAPETAGVVPDAPLGSAEQPTNTPAQALPVGGHQRKPRWEDLDLPQRVHSYNKYINFRPRYVYGDGFGGKEGYAEKSNGKFSYGGVVFHQGHSGGMW